MNKNKLSIYFLLIVSFNLIFIQFGENVHAERVYGNGAVNPGADYYRTSNYPDKTVKVPLGLSWEYDYIYNVPMEKGLSLTNYRVYFGDGNDIVGINDQTGKDFVSDSYKVGNPFYKSFSSSYGSVTTALEGSRDNSTPSGNSLFFGTSGGRIGKLNGYGLNDKKNAQTLKFSGVMNSEPINYFGYVSSGDYIAAASESLIRMVKTSDLSLKWTGGIPSGGKISGMTSLASSDLIVTTDHGLNKGYGYIYNSAVRNSGYGVKPSETIDYFAGIPRAPTFDKEDDLIYSVDKEGRIYQHDKAGDLVNMAYVGDASNRGYDTYGGLAIDNNYVYASTTGSSVSSTRGTISRHSKNNIDSKVEYVHSAKITTTPILLSGLLYFGDSNGRVYALNPSTMNRVSWYLDETLMTPRDYYDIGGIVRTLIGADNHLVAGNVDRIVGFKGRPDYYVAEQNVNGSRADGARINFYSNSMPSINVNSRIGNKGTFDYDIYTDFNGSNSQKTEFDIRNIDSYESVVLFSPSYTNNVPSKHNDEDYPSNNTYFQIPVNGSYTISNTFKPDSEGRFSFTTVADETGQQKEFDNYGSNDVTSYFDVVDMRNPSANARSNVLNRGDTNIFDLSITQEYSQRSYVFEVRYPNGTNALYKSGNGTPPSSMSMSIASNAPRGSYDYRLRIKNKFNEWLYSSWKSFDVVNIPPNAGFNTNKMSFVRGENVFITSTASDPDGDSLSHDYLITSPSGIKTYSSSANPSFKATELGTYSISQTVHDGAGGSDSYSSSIQVVNRGPNADFDTDKSSYYNDERIYITSKATDPDGDTLTHSYKVTRPDGSVYYNSQANPFISSLQKGTYTIRQTVTDGNGGSDSITKTVTVQNRGPNAGFTTNKSNYLDNEKIYVTSTASDPDGDPLTHSYKVTRPNGSTFTTTSKNPNFGSLTPGNYRIDQTVTDPSGAKDSFSRTVSVKSANRPPSAGFNFNKSKYYKGELVSITSTATDPDGDSLSHSYEITRPSGSKFTVNQTNPSFTANETGTYVVKQTVSDPLGLSDTVTKSQWVQTKPTPGFSTNKTSFYRGETVRVTTSAFDEDGGNVSHLYEVTAPNGQKSTYTSSNPAFSVNRLGNYTIKQTVTDDEGDKASITRQITVNNRGPVAGFNLNKSKYYKGETISINNSAYDADGDPLNYVYEITRPNGQKSTSSLPNPSFIASMPGTYTIKQTVSDPYGGSDSVTKTQWVQTLPTPGFNTDKSSYVRGETMNISSTAFDEDGGGLSYVYEVTAPDGSKRTSTAADPSFSVTQLGDYTIKQTITDNEGDVASITKKVNVRNQPPIAGFRLDKVKYYKGESIRVTSTATDPDGDALTYRYDVTRPDGSKFSSTTANPSFKATETGTYTIKQTIVDPYGASDSMTKTQWVQTLPTPGFITDKGIYVRGETVDITNKAFDEDGGSVTVSYEVEAPDGQKKMYNTPNPQFNVEQNGDYTITQTVTDDEGDKATVTKKVNVVNQPPEAGFDTDAAEYFIGDIVQVTSTATDPDNDPLTFEYLVTKPNGSTLTKTTKDFTFKTDQLGEYTIKQTVKDSFDDTDTVSKSVLVKDLVITGTVKHTAKWQEKHTALGNAPNQFYSGETFVLEADITNYPANYVNVEFNGKQVSGQNMRLFTSLSKQSGTRYTGELYDPEMSEADTMLESGIVNFDFEVQFSNGTIRRATVPVRIIGSAYEAFQMHQSH